MGPEIWEKNWDWGSPWPELRYPPERTWDQRSGKEPGTGVPQGKDLGPETWERTWDWGIPHPGKGPGTRDQGKNLGLGYTPSPPPPPVWTDRYLWKHYFPHSSDAGGKKPAHPLRIQSNWLLIDRTDLCMLHTKIYESIEKLASPCN